MEEAVWEEEEEFVFQNCVDVVREAGGDVPRNPRIWAKYLPVKSTELPLEGATIVAKTNYGKNGHVTLVRRLEGNLIVVADSFLVVGSVLPPDKYLGEV